MCRPAPASGPFAAEITETFFGLAKGVGNTVTIVNSEYSPSKVEAGTETAKRANEASIPIFLVSALLSSRGYDIPTGVVGGD